jgi:hypothetical protein
MSRCPIGTGITVTKQHLEESVQVLNERIPYLDFSIGYAYGGARLERRDGSVDVSHRGTKREILTYIHAMITGIDALFHSKARKRIGVYATKISRSPS